jgi:hypothetical protein
MPTTLVLRQKGLEVDKVVARAREVTVDVVLHRLRNISHVLGGVKNGSRRVPPAIAAPGDRRTQAAWDQAVQLLCWCQPE